jgi:hypothetical protein
MKFTFSLLFIGFMLVQCAPQEVPEPVNPILAVTGTVIEHDNFPSEFVESRNIEVWLPCRAKFSWFYLLNLVRVGMSCYATPELSPARWRR